MSRGGDMMAVGRGFDALVVRLILAMLFFLMMESIVITTALRKGIPLRMVTVLMNCFMLPDK